MSITASLALCLSVVLADVEVGDKVVTLTTAPVMSGPEKLAEVQPGVELTAKGVNGRWVLVSVPQKGKQIQGWVLSSNLVAGPGPAFRILVVGHQPMARWSMDKIIETVKERFQSADKNGDALLSSTEFLHAVRKPTLDDLNASLRREVAEGVSATGLNVLTPGFHMSLMGSVHQFRGWQRAPSFDEAAQLTDEFLGWQRPYTAEQGRRTLEQIQRLGPEAFAKRKDIRRSRLARELWDREDPTIRERRAEALFRWADGEGNGSLSLGEFKQALL